MTKENVTQLGEFLCREFIQIIEVAYLNGFLIVTFWNEFGDEDSVHTKIPTGNTMQDKFNLLRALTIQLVCKSNMTALERIQ